MTLEITQEEIPAEHQGESAVVLKRLELDLSEVEVVDANATFTKSPILIIRGVSENVAHTLRSSIWTWASSHLGSCLSNPENIKRMIESATKKVKKAA